MPNVGDRVALIDCADPYATIEPGTRGTVRLIDSLGTVHVVWMTVRRLGSCPAGTPGSRSRTSRGNAALPL